MDVIKENESDSLPLSRPEAAHFVMNHMFNHTTFLLLGGYTISSAISRCQIELKIASYLQQALGQSPKFFILAIMLLGLFLSMWISNHTGTHAPTTLTLSPLVITLHSQFFILSLYLPPLLASTLQLPFSVAVSSYPSSRTSLRAVGSAKRWC